MVYITYLDAHIFIWNTHTSFSFNTPATTPVTQSLTTAGHKDGFVCEVAWSWKRLEFETWPISFYIMIRICPSPNNAVIMVCGVYLSSKTKLTKAAGWILQNPHRSHRRHQEKTKLAQPRPWCMGFSMVKGLHVAVDTAQVDLVWWGSCCHCEDGVLVPKSLRCMGETMMQLIVWSLRRDKRDWSKVTLMTLTWKLFMPSP